MTKGTAFAVADGIGSSHVSQVASETAVKTFLDDYFSTSDTWSVKKSGLRVLSAINAWLFAQTRNGPHRYQRERGYICTFSALVIKSHTAHVFHVGDSRIYRLHKGAIEQLTHDHRGVGESGSSYLTRALGMSAMLDMEYQSFSVSEGDVFWLVTDGVFEYVDEDTIARRLETTSDFDRLPDELVGDALKAGSDDNLTLQMVRIDQLPEPNLEELQDGTRHLPLPPALSARSSLDGYQILRELYISSRSHVYLAMDAETQRQVVIKTPSGESRHNDSDIEALLMEDWIARRIDNDHVMKAVSTERKRHYVYTVMEYIEGSTLSQWMNDHPNPDLETVRNLVGQIAKGLQAFHRQEMVHQDLRPQNILIDRNGTIKIIDFGAVKVAGVSEIKPTNEGLVGTMQFSAPEYFLAEAGTRRSDIFSLGVIAYQLLSQQLPYGTAVSKTRTRRDQQRLRYARLSDHNETIPAWVDYALAKAVHIDPAKRYGELSEFIHDLSRPNQQFARRAQAPLVERNPVLVWQLISAALLGVIVIQGIL